MFDGPSRAAALRCPMLPKGRVPGLHQRSTSLPEHNLTHSQSTLSHTSLPTSLGGQHNTSSNGFEDSSRLTGVIDSSVKSLKDSTQDSTPYQYFVLRVDRKQVSLTCLRFTIHFIMRLLLKQTFLLGIDSHKQSSSTS